MPAAALFPPNVEAALVTSQYPVFSSARSHGAAAAAKTWEPAAEYLVQWKGGGAEGRQGYWLLLKAANEISWNTVFGKCISLLSAAIDSTVWKQYWIEGAFNKEKAEVGAFSKFCENTANIFAPLWGSQHKNFTKCKVHKRSKSLHRPGTLQQWAPFPCQLRQHGLSRLTILSKNLNIPSSGCFLHPI